MFVGGEVAGGEAADVQDADHAALDEQRDAEQRADALLAQDRVVDVGVVDVLDRDRAALGRDAAGEAAPEGDLDAALDLLLDAAGGAGAQDAGRLVEQRIAAVSADRTPVMRLSNSSSRSSCGRYASAASVTD